MLLVSHPKKVRIKLILQRLDVSDTKGVGETRGVECLTIQFPPLPTSQSVGITCIDTQNNGLK